MRVRCTVQVQRVFLVFFTHVIIKQDMGGLIKTAPLRKEWKEMQQRSDIFTYLYQAASH